MMDEHDQTSTLLSGRVYDYGPLLQQYAQTPGEIVDDRGIHLSHVER